MQIASGFSGSAARALLVSSIAFSRSSLKRKPDALLRLSEYSVPLSMEGTSILATHTLETPLRRTQPPPTGTPGARGGGIFRPPGAPAAPHGQSWRRKSTTRFSISLMVLTISVLTMSSITGTFSGSVTLAI